MLEHYFEKVNRFKPKSSRSESAEHYIVCCELKKRAVSVKELQNLKSVDLVKVKSKKNLK